ncbi:MAG: hypothetical protein ACK6AT_01280 [Planctomycetota bacterium]|jgi:uncharacterized repeat protein (TIGR01451 family)
MLASPRTSNAIAINRSTPGSFAKLLWGVCGSLCILLNGCKTLTLPAINPNGGTIFSGQTTTLVSPHGANNGYPAQGPAYQTPPEPKKCMHGVPMGGDGKSGHPCKLCKGGHTTADEARARCGELLLTPTKLVAPVGGEVILLAGICGKDGMLVTGEPIEWMLSPESVGQIIDVGDNNQSQKQHLFKKHQSQNDAGKIDVDFARGRTSTEPGKITRGTSRTDDDLPIRKGQTWLSLSSPSEGVSKVTVMAPESEAWDKRRQTATIYWVDARWEFPQIQQAQSGQRITLVTKVSKADGLVPAEGWIVRYRSLNPEIARFLPQYGEVFEKYVDRNGNAVVELVNMLQPDTISKSNASALIEVEVVRPGQSSENMPELPLGRGTVQVTWSSAEINLIARGPEVAVPGQPLSYGATIQNEGLAQAENVVLTAAVPNGMTLKSITPEPNRRTGNNMSWDIGVLGSRQALDVQLVVEATSEMDARVVFEATGAPGIQKNAVVSTLVQKPQVTLSINPDPTTTQVAVGDLATFNMKLTNTGNQTITNLVVFLEAGPGLTHARDGAREVSRPVEYLAPGQSVPLSAQFLAEREGELTLKATARTANQILTGSAATIRAMPGTQRMPQVELDMRATTGANPIAVGTATSVQLFVRNTGPVAVRNLIVTLKYDPALTPTGASAGFEPMYANQILRWRLPELPVGTTTDYQMNFSGGQVSNDAQVVGTIESEDRSVRVVKNVGIPIVQSGAPSAGVPSNPAPNSPQPTNPTTGVMPAPATDLVVSIEPVSRAARLNEQSDYIITVRNASAINQQQVALVLQVPEGLQVNDVRGPAASSYQFDDAGRVLAMDPIQTLRPGDQVAYRVVFLHRLVGEGKLTAVVKSGNAPNPVSSASTIVTLGPSP